MKPRFALNLSHEGIGLLHRRDGRWSLVGEVALDDPELSEALRVLRGTAAELEGGGILSKLIIPSSQILYRDMPVGDGDRATQEAELRAGLEGVTPYPVDDLVFDWEISGDNAQVAVVARETLDEAESFAAEHKFNPVSFVAVPENGEFPREPWFGNTGIAGDLLPEGETLERDAEPVRIAAAPGAAAGPAPEEAAGEEAAAADAGAQTAAMEEPPEAPDAPPAETPRAAEIAAEEPDEVSPPEAPAAAPVAEPAAPQGPPLPEISPLAPPETRPAFLSSRDHATDAGPAGAAAAGVAPRITLGAAAPAEPPRPAPGNRNVGVTAPAAPVDDPEPAPPPAAEKPAARPATGRKKAKAGAARRQTTPPPLRKAEPAAPPPKTVARVTPIAAPPPNEADALTVFGARRKETPPAAPRRLGLVMTAALLLVMAAVALWAAFFMADEVAILPAEATAPVAVPDTEIAALPEGNAAAVETPLPVPRPRPETAPVASPPPPLPAPEAAEAAPEADVAAPPALAEPDAAELAEEPEPLVPSGPLSPEMARAAYLATGIWPIAPEVPATPVPDRLDELFLAAIDPEITGEDAIALPGAGALTTDAAFPAQPPPPGPGMRFELDARGLVTPSPEGTLSPDGTIVYSGRPPVVPPPRPDTDAALTPEPGQPGADPLRARLAGFQPRQRPDDLALRLERAGNGGYTRAELAANRPKPRPQSLQEAAQEAAAVAAAIESATSGTEAAAEEIGGIAIASSRVPPARPKSLVQAAARAQQQAKAAEAEKTAPAVPAAAVITPQVASPGTVAKQATIENAINLHKVNLIGVYGSASDRRALVRLSSGKYVKVQVGDKIDGGRVAAISEDALRYVKNGKNIVIQLPRG